ncbi:D-amino-acid transaminase [Telmatospirillum sp. J64-1]|uniref:D-amino-acid transaminase n=1 Tax=Telmatospirillum sp. J64-1 TaxID=2502183 RepID=UPI00115E5081|nr:D-amino-acid transaminase [Telmatospirillum sp. J64-1]
MSRIIYVNGRYQPYAEAKVHVEDRGYQFADGVYEAIAAVKGQLVDEERHLDRLDRSLRELRMAQPMERAPLMLVMREVIRRNGVRNGYVYLQVTRGVARRDHVFPLHARPGLVIFARSKKPTPQAVLDRGIAVVSVPDIRWKRRDIKSLSLLPNVLAKQAAKEQGAFEAWLVDDEGFVTEGSATNAWIITGDGELVTRDASNAILNGVTRRAVLELAAEQGLRLVERAFTLEEAKAAREAFITSTTNHILPVTRLDGGAIGDGKPGETTKRLRALYLDAIGLGV